MKSEAAILAWVTPSIFGTQRRTGGRWQRLHQGCVPHPPPQAGPALQTLSEDSAFLSVKTRARMCVCTRVLSSRNGDGDGGRGRGRVRRAQLKSPCDPPRKGVNVQ